MLLSTLFYLQYVISNNFSRYYFYVLVLGSVCVPLCVGCLVEAGNATAAEDSSCESGFHIGIVLGTLYNVRVCICNYRLHILGVGISVSVRNHIARPVTCTSNVLLTCVLHTI